MEKGPILFQRNKANYESKMVWPTTIHIDFNIPNISAQESLKLFVDILSVH